jgi:hypothetical protein
MNTTPGQRNFQAYRNSPLGVEGIKACSFLPAATQMIYDMSLQHLLFGVTFECPAIALNEKQKVVRCVLEGNNYSSAEIDKIFSASKAQGKKVYTMLMKQFYNTYNRM